MSRKLLALVFPLLLGVVISGPLVVDNVTVGYSSPVVGDAPLVIDTTSTCCTAVDACPLDHKFNLQTDDILYAVCHARDNGIPKILDTRDAKWNTVAWGTNNDANQIFIEDAGSNVSMVGAWIRHSGGVGTNLNVVCDGPDLADEMVVSVMQIRGALSTDSPIDVTTGLTAKAAATTLNCPVITTVTDNTLVTCSAIARFDHIASPSTLYTSESTWSPHDISEDPTCTSTGFAGQVYIADKTPVGTTPAESFDQGTEGVPTSGRLITATVAFKK